MRHKWCGVQEFVSVVDTGSFSGAAKQLGHSKSHISKHVKELEQRLGVDLLHRTTRTIQLTNQGLEFYHRCSQILHNLDDAEVALTEQSAELRGEIRMTVAGLFGEDFLAPIVASFLKDYPRVSVDIMFSNRKVNIGEERFDLALRSGIIEDGPYHHEEIHKYPLVTVASRRYLAARGTPETLADLKKHNCLAGTLPYWRFAVNGQCQELFIKGNWKSNNGCALVQAAKHDLGIIQVPDFYVTDSGDALTPILENFAVRNVKVWAIYPHRQYLPRRVQLLIGYLKERIAAQHQSRLAPAAE